MKEFIGKLIKRLEENTMLMANSREFWDNPQNGKYVSEVIPKEKAISIVNQLAEEYKPNTQADKIRTMNDEKLVEKIIDRLKEAKYYSEDGVHEVVGYGRAIGIIHEEVEAYNDVCEWFKYDYRTIAPKNHDAENPYWRIPDNMDKLKFCPYCGKKIKVVE